MATKRNIDSPGIQISEVDLSLRPVQTSSTNIFIPGFASRGPINTTITVASLSEFEQIYGQPTNGAERYFYNTVKAALQSPANIFVTRLPYGSGGALGSSTDSYVSLLAYPARYIDTSVTNYISDDQFYAVNSTISWNYVSAVPTLSAAWPNGIPAGSTAPRSLSATAVGASTTWSSVSGSTTLSTASLTASNAQNYTQSTSGTFILGAPIHYTLNQSQWSDFMNGSLVNYQPTCDGTLTSQLSTLGYAALIIANPPTSDINALYEGYYIGICDNTALNQTNNYDTITTVKSLVNSAAYVATPSYGYGLAGSLSANYLTLPRTRLGFALSATNQYGSTEGSLSQIQQNSIVTYDAFSSRTYDDSIIIGLYKLKQSIFNANNIQLGFSLEEGYFGSLDSKRQINGDAGGPAQSFFIEGLVNKNSSNLLVKVNPYLSRANGGNTYLQPDGVPAIKIRAANPTLLNNALFTSSNPSSAANSQILLGFNNRNVITNTNSTIGTTDALFSLGTYNVVSINNKAIGDIPVKLQNAVSQMMNPDVYPINIFCEGGLGTIYAISRNLGGYYDDNAYVNVQALTAFNAAGFSDPLISDYLGVTNVLQGFVENPARKDMIGILDPLTPILVQANSVKTINDPDLAFFTQNVLWPLKNQFATINSSYLCTYGTCARVTDVVTGNPIWVPFSGFAAASMANTDYNYQPWQAPAGFKRGVLSQLSDIAYYPRQKQRDQLYQANINPVAFFPSDGFVIYGQKTLQRTPSAFDRINVRRLFLDLEIATRNTLKYYVFEPNTLFTRTQVINTLTPIFDNAKNTEGIYDYLIICDERNNTPSVIDDNTMVVDIYIKPVRTAEFILANFYATTTSVNFQEITS